MDTKSVKSLCDDCVHKVVCKTRQDNDDSIVSDCPHYIWEGDPCPVRQYGGNHYDAREARIE